MFAQGNLVTHVVGTVFHLLNWCVHHLFAVFIFHRLHPFHFGLVPHSFKMRYLPSSIFHLLINATNRIKVKIHKTSAKEYFYAEIISDQNTAL